MTKERRPQAEEQTIRLLALANALSAATTTREVAAATIEHAQAVLGAAGIVLARMEDDGANLSIVDVSALPDAIRSAWQLIPLDAALPLSDVARSGEPPFLASRDDWSARYPALLPTLVETGHHANAIAPLVAQGRVIAVLGAAFDAPRSFGEGERALVLAIASQCALAFERASLFEAERATRDRLEVANRAKSEFLAVMSHELRTPLNAIGGYAELLELGIHGPVTAEQRLALGRIQMSQRHLLGLIENVLNFARLDAGATQYHITEVPVDEVLRACEGLLVPQARAKEIVLETSDCAAELRARADPEKLQQIVLNLLSNAIKFTERGGRVTLRCSAAHGRVRVQVQDTGRGVPEAYRERVFHPFVQVDMGFSRREEGTGLGLAISRDLARGMGGDLTLESVEGEGSVFTLTLAQA